MSAAQDKGYSPLFGCCVTQGSFMPQNAEDSNVTLDTVALLVQCIQEVLAQGYDYAELTVGALTQLTQEQFDRLVQLLREAGIRIPVCNSFIPPTMKITGPDVRSDMLQSYVELAMKRVQAIGGDIIVFGSGGARAIPDGFSLEQGMEQIKQFLRICNETAEKYSVTVAIEPLNSKECNVIHKVSEALTLAEQLNLTNIQVLADAYHMYLEQEPFESIGDALSAQRLVHVHYAESDRSYPNGSVQEGVNFEQLFTLLHQHGYTGRISAECSSAQAMQDCGASLQYVKRQLPLQN